MHKVELGDANEVVTSTEHLSDLKVVSFMVRVPSLFSLLLTPFLFLLFSLSPSLFSFSPLYFSLPPPHHSLFSFFLLSLFPFSFHIFIMHVSKDCACSILLQSDNHERAALEQHRISRYATYVRLAIRRWLTDTVSWSW